MKTRKRIRLVPANSYVQLGTTGTGRSYAVNTYASIIAGEDITALVNGKLQKL